ncbi:hypothetical protein [Polaribacter sp. R77954]|uniref:hypothetical protein n=1 Tax=Polaribacter sp. R77954 TaxID=3093870 RepID=UPI0037C8E5C3
MTKKYQKTFLFLLLLLICSALSAQRALYVDNFNSILGNNDKEDKLLYFAQDNGFTTLILYELHLVRKRLPMNNYKKISILSDFITLAKTKYNVKKVVASGENSEIFLNYLHVYNETRKDDIERFNSYNIEYEFWHKTNSDLGGYYCENYLRKNKIPCTSEGSFNYFKETISVLDFIRKETNYPLGIEVYLANFDKKQILALKKYNIKYRISAYASNVELSSKEIKKELKILSNCKCIKEVSIILSSEPFFMSGHLKYNSLEKTEKEFENYISKYKNIHFTEFTYFKYSDLKKSIGFRKLRRTGIKPKY